MQMQLRGLSLCGVRNQASVIWSIGRGINVEKCQPDPKRLQVAQLLLLARTGRSEQDARTIVRQQILRFGSLCEANPLFNEAQMTGVANWGRVKATLFGSREVREDLCIAETMG